MYEELVKELRDNGEEFRKLPLMGFICKQLLQAADAIEELSKKYLASEVDNTNLTGWLAEEHAKNRWIPVTERLPKYGTTVLVYGSQGGIYTARYERARAEWDRDSWWKLNSKSHICNPTHWMPLPEPPKEET